MNEEINR